MFFMRGARPRAVNKYFVALEPRSRMRRVLDDMKVYLMLFVDEGTCDILRFVLSTNEQRVLHAKQGTFSRPMTIAVKDRLMKMV